MLTTSTYSEDQTHGILDDLREIVQDIRRSRSLIFQLTLRDLRVRYKQAFMGFAWALITPILVVCAGLLVRGAVLQVGGGHLDGAATMGIAIKALAWAFVAGAVSFATTALTANVGLITKVYFPRETMPLSIVLASTVDSLIGATVLSLFLLAMGWRPTAATMWVPLLAATLFILTLAAAILVSCANLFYRDVKYVVQLATSYGLFFTPVFYEPGMLGGRWVTLQMMNPVAPILEGLRLAVANGHDLLRPLASSDGAMIWSPWYLWYAVAAAVVSLVVSVVIFHRAQYRFAECV